MRRSLFSFAAAEERKTRAERRFFFFRKFERISSNENIFSSSSFDRVVTRLPNDIFRLVSSCCSSSISLRRRCNASRQIRRLDDVARGERRTSVQSARRGRMGNPTRFERFVRHLRSVESSSRFERWFSFVKVKISTVPNFPSPRIEIRVNTNAKISSIRCVSKRSVCKNERWFS